MADINEIMKAYSEDAVDYAKQLNISLDYSEESIRRVEEMCVMLYNAIPKGFFAKLFKKNVSEKKRLHMSNMLGGYIGEVFIKHYGGSWAIENFMNQGNTLVLNIDETKIFPVAKVYKRLTNGPEDNVHHYFHFISKELKGNQH